MGAASNDAGGVGRRCFKGRVGTLLNLPDPPLRADNQVRQYLGYLKSPVIVRHNFQHQAGLGPVGNSRRCFNAMMILRVLNRSITNRSAVLETGGGGVNCSGLTHETIPCSMAFGRLVCK